MTTRQEMSNRYSDMTAAMNNVASMQRKQYLATAMGNLISAAHMRQAHKDAQHLQSGLGDVQKEVAAAASKIENGLRKVDRSLQNVDQSLKEMHNDLHTDIDDLKHITFAQWRDGLGRPYFEEFRPKAIHFLETYRHLSDIWSMQVATRISQIAFEYPNWKKPEWRDEALSDGLFYLPPTPPKLIEAPDPEDYETKDENSGSGAYVVGLIGTIILIIVGLSVFMPLPDEEPPLRAKDITEGSESYLSVVDELSTDKALSSIEYLRTNPGGPFSMNDEPDIRKQCIWYYDTYPNFSTVHIYYRSIPDPPTDGGYTSTQLCDDAIRLNQERLNQSNEYSKLWNETRIHRLKLGALFCFIAAVVFIGGAISNVKRIQRFNEKSRLKAQSAHEEAQNTNQQSRNDYNKELTQFVQRNEQARTSAVSVFVNDLGFNPGSDYGNRWASPQTRADAERLATLINTEVIRPPSIDQRVPAAPIRLNQGIKPQFRSTLEKELSRFQNSW